MTYKEFEYNVYKSVLPNKVKNYGFGQALMLYLCSVWNREYKRINSIHHYSNHREIDCYYSDELIDNTLEHLKKEWKNYPN